MRRKRTDWPNGQMAVGVTGHRTNNPTLVQNEARVAAVIATLLETVEEAARSRGAAYFAGEDDTMGFRLLTMLADGADTIAEQQARTRGWEICAPTPFGRALTAAMLAVDAADIGDIDALLQLDAHPPADDAPPAFHKAAAMLARTRDARVIALAERDDEFIARWKSARAAKDAHPEAWTRFVDVCSQRYALGARLVVEHADLLIAVWDGESRATVGGAGRTLEVALNDGVPVIWVNPAQPENWRILRTRADLAQARADDPGDANLDVVSALVGSLIAPGDPDRPEDVKASRGLAAFRRVRHRMFGSLVWSGYRLLEWGFGGAPDGARTALLPRFATPETYGETELGGVYGKARDLLEDDPDFVDKLQRVTSRRFALADGSATRLSDAYRGGMVLSFALAWIAVVGGALGAESADAGMAWPWFAAQFATISAILVLTLTGRAVFRWHRRWLETRRVAEYLRHSHILALLGVMRPLGRWPGAVGDLWPEWYARQTLREIGPPRATISADYIRGVFEDVVLDHVVGQRDYHDAKARRLQSVDRALERFATLVFAFVFVVVGAYLATTFLELGFSLDARHIGVLGVVTPMLAATIASIRFFCDFERFADISVAAAARFRNIERDITAMLETEGARFDYETASAILHRIDGATVSELESWQAIFGTKGMMTPTYM